MIELFPYTDNGINLDSKTLNELILSLLGLSETLIIQKGKHSNPNIVVGADAEQVIVANQHGKNTKNNPDIKFQYISGI